MTEMLADVRRSASSNGHDMLKTKKNRARTRFFFHPMA
jgi:hypothetical protein